MADLKVQYEFRNGTASEWAAVNPVLAKAEPGFELGTGKFKVGDGTTAWNSLPYVVGADGPEGPEGPQGPAGPTGQDGTDGAQGLPGTNGLNGTDGADGQDGTDGAQGPVGPIGPQGDAGLQGIQGVQGDDGPQGIQGLPGADGADGATGPQGDQGIQGIQGPAGNDGADGATGPQGIPGADGSDGLPGADGADGAQGIPGADGADGSDGAQGIQGPIGPEGPEGPEGPPGTDGSGLTSYGSFHLTTGGLTGMNNTAATLVINATEINTGEYTLSGNEITVSATGDYEINAFSYINNSATSRSEFTMWLEVDGTQVAGTRSGIYERGYDSGSTGHISKIMTISAGNAIRLRIQRTDGSTTAGYQDNNGTGITIKRLDA